MEREHKRTPHRRRSRAARLHPSVCSASRLCTGLCPASPKSWRPKPRHHQRCDSLHHPPTQWRSRGCRRRDERAKNHFDGELPRDTVQRPAGSETARRPSRGSGSIRRRRGSHRSAAPFRLPTASDRARRASECGLIGRGAIGILASQRTSGEPSLYGQAETALARGQRRR
jgi:hypothetical protein